MLALAAVAQPLALLAVGTHLTGLALAVLAVDVPLAATMLWLAARRVEPAAVPEAPAEIPERSPALTEA